MSKSHQPAEFARASCAGVQLAGRFGIGGDPGAPLDLDRLLPGGPWEVELGFGKGRFLLRRAAEEPSRRFLGIEIAGKYFRLAARRAERRGLSNVLLLRGEALYALSVLLPRGLAAAVHVYFPDPWPKSRHQKRRLFDRDTVDLLLDLLVPGGRLFFATDFLSYGESVEELLRSHPAIGVEGRAGPWPEGARTNYEAKYMREGRPILRLEATLDPGENARLHPAGGTEVLSAVAPDEDEDPAAGG